MKWVAFGTALVATFPLAWWLKRRPSYVPLVWSIVGFLPFVQPGVPFFKLALWGWPDFPGYTHGLEVTVLDLVVLALCLALPPARHSPPLRVLRGAYLVALAISIAQADYPLAALFPVWQLLRMYFVFAVAVRGCQDSRMPTAVLRGMQWGVLFTCALALFQRYVLNFHEVWATFGHENYVGMACDFAVMPAFALVLGGRAGWLNVATPLAGAVAVILSLSRGGVLMLVIGLGLLLANSLRRLTPRKALIAFSGLFLGIVLFGKAYDQLRIRFTERSYGTFDTEVEDERAQLEVASAMMLRDNPLGVGANHFSWVLRTRGYFQRVGLFDRGKETYSIKVHNLYWMIATETGYFGLIVYVVLLMALLGRVFWHGLRAPGRVQRDLLLGLGTAILLFHVHGLLEWVQVTMYMQYFLWLSAGVALGLTQQVQESSTASLRSPVDRAPRRKPQARGTDRTPPERARGTT